VRNWGLFPLPQGPWSFRTGEGEGEGEGGLAQECGARMRSSHSKKFIQARSVLADPSSAPPPGTGLRPGLAALCSLGGRPAPRGSGFRPTPALPGFRALSGLPCGQRGAVVTGLSPEADHLIKLCEEEAGLSPRRGRGRGWGTGAPNAPAGGSCPLPSILARSRLRFLPPNSD
jgi:hypothetical protein